MARTRGGVAQVEEALEQLFRLTVNRKMHTRQTAAVGVEVSRAGYAVLRCIDAAGQMTLGEVAKACSMDAATAGRQVRLLEDEGLVGRSTASDDARVTVVRLTDDGREVYRRVRTIRTEYMERVLDGWSAADCARLAELVGRLVDDLREVPFRPGRQVSRD